MVSLQHITLEFGARSLLHDINWHIGKGERIGLVGRNGAGKSTLLKLIAGELSPQEGVVNRQRELRVGFFHQELLSFRTEAPIRDVAMSAFDEINRCWHRLQELSQQMATTQQENLMQEYGELLHQFETANGYQLKARTEEVLEGLGFRTSDLDRPFHTFSGGWRMRVLLARLLLQQPDLLLLDEPTNHLDLPSMQWLENYLQHIPSTCIIASHDRYFLDRLVEKIVEIDQQQLFIYTGNYSTYTAQKQARLEHQQRAYENQQAFIQHQQAFIERFRAKATKAAQVQSAIKKLEKLERIEPVEGTTITPRFQFKMQREPGRLIMSGHHISKSYNENAVLKDVSFEIMRGDKIGLIGANGRGKSTLLRILAGQESFEGKLHTGHHVVMAYYAQHHTEQLNPANTILQEVEQHAPDYTTQEIRNILGQFLFSGDDILKPIQVLSGGEKARVALAKLFLTQANFLLLDEPTNHLDIPSIDALKQALSDFPGSYIVVSHDRYFLEGMIQRIWYIEDAQLREWQGDLNSWIQQKAFVTASSSSTYTPQQISQPAAEERARRKAYQQQKRQFEKIEKQLDALQEQIRDVELQLADPALYADKQEFLKIEQLYRNLQSQYQDLQTRYEEAFERLMEMEKEL